MLECDVLRVPFLIPAFLSRLRPNPHFSQTVYCDLLRPSPCRATKLCETCRLSPSPDDICGKSLSDVTCSMEALLTFARENSGPILFIGLIGLYFALQLWILPAFGVPT